MPHRHGVAIPPEEQVILARWISRRMADAISQYVRERDAEREREASATSASSRTSCGIRSMRPGWPSTVCAKRSSPGAVAPWRSSTAARDGPRSSSKRPSLVLRFIGSGAQPRAHRAFSLFSGTSGECRHRGSGEKRGRRHHRSARADGGRGPRDCCARRSLTSSPTR